MYKSVNQLSNTLKSLAKNIKIQTDFRLFLYKCPACSFLGLLVILMVVECACFFPLVNNALPCSPYDR